MNKKSLIVKIVVLTILILVMATPVLGASDNVRVWVEYKPGQSNQVRNALQAAGAQFHFQFERLNAYVVTVPDKALDNLERNPRVVNIEVDPVRTLIAPQRVTINDLPDENNGEQIIPYGVDMVQARMLWDSNDDGVVDEDAPTGEGVTVCIIDTGYYSGHEDLADVNLLGGISQVDEDFETDGYGHGTHVAGTISAFNNSLGVVGVTPGTVDFYIVKIFDNAGEWVANKHASNLVAAAYECADNGAKIINMSLGGSSRSGYEERAFDDLYYELGVLSIAAAGNENSDKFHSPSAYPSVVSVAAIDEAYAKADFSNFGPTIEVAAPGVDVLSTVPFKDGSFIEVDGVEYAGFQMTYAPSGTATGPLADGGLCDGSGDWGGMVVLCQRGDISFYDKAKNVEDSGGVAAVVYNNEPGSFLGTLGEEGITILAISLSQEAGQFLVANKLGLDATVFSEILQPASGYEAWGGTSMATPHVVGVAALLWSADLSLTNVEIREALVETAMDLGEEGWDEIFGFGLVQAYDAWEYLATSGQGPKGPGK
jgi:subtilisin family serine protease